MSDELMMVSADTLAEMFRKSHVVDEATMKMVLPIFHAAIELAADAVKAEREACARLAEHVWFDARDTEWDGGVECAKGKIAAAIRARGKT